jgi:hypothetical protein
MKTTDIRNCGQNPHDYIRSLLKHRNECKIAHNTRLIVNDDDSVSVWFHHTEIVRAYRSGRTILRNGGYATTTTKQRLNAFLPGMVGINQTNFEWNVNQFVRNPNTGGYKVNRIAAFTDGMSVMFDDTGGYVGSAEYISPLAAAQLHTLATAFVFSTDNPVTVEAMSQVCRDIGTGVLVMVKHYDALVARVADMRASGLRAA